MSRRPAAAGAVALALRVTVHFRRPAAACRTPSVTTSARRRRRPRDRRVVALGQRTVDVAHLDGLVGLDDVDERRLRAALDRRARHDHGAAERVDEQARVDELVREERPVLVRKRRLQLDGAGGRIDLVVDGEQRAGRELRLADRGRRRRRSDGVPAAAAAARCGRLSSGIVNTTAIGWSCVITTRPFGRWRGRCCRRRPAAGRRGR